MSPDIAKTLRKLVLKEINHNNRSIAERLMQTGVDTDEQFVLERRTYGQKLQEALEEVNKHYAPSR